MNSSAQLQSTRAEINLVQSVRIPFDDGLLNGELVLPEHARGLLVISHAGHLGQNAHDRVLARSLRQSGFGTLLVDLLTAAEAETDDWSARYRFDYELLAGRVVTVSHWARGENPTHQLPMGLMATGTGAAAVLLAAAWHSTLVSALLCRSGRPVLSPEVLGEVTTPTLFVVGSREFDIMRLNELADRLIPAQTRLEVIADATHRFDEPGAVERLGELAGDWFLGHFGRTATSEQPDLLDG